MKIIITWTIQMKHWKLVSSWQTVILRTVTSPIKLLTLWMKQDHVYIWPTSMYPRKSKSRKNSSKKLKARKMKLWNRRILNSLPVSEIRRKSSRFSWTKWNENGKTVWKRIDRLLMQRKLPMLFLWCPAFRYSVWHKPKESSWLAWRRICNRK